MMYKLRHLRTFLALLGMAVVSPSVAHAQDGVGFRFLFGHQAMTGDLGAQFDPAVDAEFSILVPVSAVRVGAGANWASFQVHDADASWSQVRFHVLAAVPLQVTPRFRPYVEGRYTFRRLRPEEDRYFGGEEQLLGDYVSKGSGFEGVVGAEVVLHPRMAVDLSAGAGTFSLDEDLADQGLQPVESSKSWSLRVGGSWFPANNR